MSKYKTLLDSEFSLEEMKDIDLQIEKGDRVYLSGELWAGKTTFAGILISKLLWKQVVVTSPTYGYYQTYRNNIYHFDLYRMDTYEDFIATGSEEIFDREDTICIVEWPERIVLDEPEYSIQIQHSSDPQKRNICIQQKCKPKNTESSILF